MDKETAKTLLSFHSGRNDDINNPKWKNGFLGSLRPFRGELIENNFFEVMECLRVLKDDLSKPMVDKNIVSDVIAITYFTRCWIDPEGMLGSNHLLSDNQTKDLMAWADIIDYCFMCLLDGAEEEAFSLYYDYLDDKLDASREHADQGLYRDAEDVVIDMRDKYGL